MPRPALLPKELTCHSDVLLRVCLPRPDVLGMGEHNCSNVLRASPSLSSAIPPVGRRESLALPAWGAVPPAHPSCHLPGLHCSGRFLGA